MKKAKILLLALLVVMAATGCRKEEDCNCGTIVADGYEVDKDCYWLEIRNTCTQNVQRFCFDYDVWLANPVGGYFCINNIEQWSQEPDGNWRNQRGN